MGYACRELQSGVPLGGAAGLSKNYLGDPFEKNDMFGMTFYVYFGPLNPIMHLFY